MKRLKGLIAGSVFALAPLSAQAAGVGGLGKFDSFAVTLCTWAQGIGLTLAVGAFIRAGIKFLVAKSNNENPWEKVTSALIGTAVIAGASIIVGFVKNAIM